MKESTPWHIMQGAHHHFHYIKHLSSTRRIDGTPVSKITHYGNYLLYVPHAVHKRIPLPLVSTNTGVSKRQECNRCIYYSFRGSRCTHSWHMTGERYDLNSSRTRSWRRVLFEVDNHIWCLASSQWVSFCIVANGLNIPYISVVKTTNHDNSRWLPS